jgi:carbon monoxide dehydrogenase subunit G
VCNDGVSEKEAKVVKMHGTHILEAPRQKVWAFLMTPESIAKVMPGCERLEEVRPDHYEATLKLGIAAVKGTYTGSVQLLDKTPPSRYRMLIDGSGTPGFIKGEATIDLEEQDGKTILTYDADTQVGGLIANVGQRMINGVAKLIISQSLKKLSEEMVQS